MMFSARADRSIGQSTRGGAVELVPFSSPRSHPPDCSNSMGDLHPWHRFQQGALQKGNRPTLCPALYQILRAAAHSLRKLLNSSRILFSLIVFLYKKSPLLSINMTTGGWSHLFRLGRTGKQQLEHEPLLFHPRRHCAAIFFSYIADAFQPVTVEVPILLGGHRRPSEKFSEPSQ